MIVRLRLVAVLLAVLSPAAFAAPAAARTFVVPNVFETQFSTTTDHFDTVLKFVYSGGLLGIPATTGATVNVYLYSDTGGVLQGSSGAICNPCMFTLNTTTRVARHGIEGLANSNAGGLGGVGVRRVTRGYAIIVVTGGDTDLVSIEAYTINAHPSPTDTTLHGLPVREIVTGP